MSQRPNVARGIKFLLVGLLALIPAGCGGGGSSGVAVMEPGDGTMEPGSPPRSDVVEVRLLASLRFQPANLIVPAGTTVRWVNTATIFHTVTPDGHTEWRRFATSRTGESFEHTFGTSGTFNYFCEPHRSVGMVGSVVVE